MNWFKSLWRAKNASAADSHKAAEPPQTPKTSGSTPANFTPRAQQTLALARQEADRLNHNFVGTEHVLLGLIRLGQGTAVTILTKMGLDLETVRQEIKKQVGVGPDQKMFGNIPYTPRVKKVLALAAKEARSLNHTYVGTEHILLGLLCEGDGVAARVLKKVGVDIERIRQEILKELDPNFSPATDSAGAAFSKESPSADGDFTLGSFTPRAQQVLALAREEAACFNHDYVGVEHLLLGLIRLGQGVATNVLAKKGLDLETVRLEIEKLVGTGSDQKPVGRIPYTPRVKKVLALAAKEAKAVNHTYVGTEHILLGLLREGDSVASRVLKHFNVDVEQTRQEILKELDPNFSPATDNTATLPPKQSLSEPPRSDSGQDAQRPKPLFDSIDTNKRYDVYCAEGNERVVVYRNALFKSRKRLFQRDERDFSCEYLELEQANGQTIFVARISVVKFCEHGLAPAGEPVSNEPGTSA